MANEVAKKPSRPAELREFIEARTDELRKALPPDILAEVFIRALMTAVALNPEIADCVFGSIWLACLQACRAGLLPDGKESAIVPYGGRATFIPMYQGLLLSFRKSGQFKWVKAGVVHEGERFEHYIDEHGEHFHHTPGDAYGTPVVRVYALAMTKDGGLFVEVMPMSEIEKIRKISKTRREESPWNQWPEEMMKKTAIRRLAKMLPNSRDRIFSEEDEEAPAIETAGPAAVALVAPSAKRPPPRTPAEQMADFAEAGADEAEAQRLAEADRNPLTDQKR